VLCRVHGFRGQIHRPWIRDMSARYCQVRCDILCWYIAFSHGASGHNVLCCADHVNPSKAFDCTKRPSLSPTASSQPSCD